MEEPTSNPATIPDFDALCAALEHEKQKIIGEMVPTAEALSDRQRVQRILIKLAEFRAAGIGWERITKAVADVGFRDGKGQPYNLNRLRQYFAGLKGRDLVKQLQGGSPEQAAPRPSPSKPDTAMSNQAQSEPEKAAHVKPAWATKKAATPGGVDLTKIINAPLSPEEQEVQDRKAAILRKD